MNYKKIYDNLISKRLKETLKKIKDGSIETHHIVPRCMNGTNDRLNKVNLTCREHYIAHLLLVKIYQGTKFEVYLRYAVNMMGYCSKFHKRKFSMNSRIYQVNRMMISKLKKGKCNEKSLKKYSWKGQTYTLREWEKITGIPYNTLRHRIDDKWDYDRVFTVKPREKRKYIYKGKEYKFRELLKISKVSSDNLRNRIDHLGWSIEDAVNTPQIESTEKHTKRNILLNGKLYSTTEISKLYNIDQNTIYNRIKLGWNIERIISTPIEKQNIEISFRGKKYKSLNSLARDYGIPTNTFSQRISKGQSVEKALGLE